MESAALVSILLSLMLHGVEVIDIILGNMNDTAYIPEFLGITLSSLQVFFPFLAIILSLVNCFTNKNSKLLKKFLLLAVSSALFFTNLYWLISWFTG